MICRLLLILLLALPCFGQCLKTDLNQDGIVNMQDLVMLLNDWEKESNCMPNSFSTYNGIDGYITIPDDNALDLGTDDFTITGVTQFRSVTVSQSLVSKADGVDGYRLYLYEDGKIRLDLSVGGVRLLFQSLISLSSNTTYFWAITASSIDKTCTLFLNSQPYSMEILLDEAWPNTNTNFNFVIGEFLSAERLSAALFDDLRIYKAALTQAQITAIVASRGVYNESQAGAASFVMNFDTDFVDNKIYSEIPSAGGGLVGTRSGAGVTIEAGELPDVLSGGSSMENILDEMWTW